MLFKLLPVGILLVHLKIQDEYNAGVRTMHECKIHQVILAPLFKSQLVMNICVLLRPMGLLLVGDRIVIFLVHRM